MALPAVVNRSWVRTFTRDEANEFAHAFLHAFFGLFCNLGVLGERSLHDASDWSKVVNVSILIKVPAIRISSTADLLGGRSMRGRRHDLGADVLVQSVATTVMAADRWLAKELLIRQEMQKQARNAALYVGGLATPVTASGLMICRCQREWGSTKN